jgi:hypothetical protein
MRTTIGPAAASAVWAVSVVLLAGCGTSSPLVSDPAPPGVTPYDGPMSLPLDHGDLASVRDRSGAAGQALECEHPAFDGGGADYAESDLYEIADDPQQALENYLDGEIWSRIPDRGYRAEREDGDRVLFSFEVAGRTKVAVIVADGVRNYDDDHGWGVESWAACDPAELPGRVTEGLGIGVWTDARGERVPVTRVRSQPGAEHCDWQDVTFLDLDGGERQFVRDTSGEFEDFTRTTYAEGMRLPAGARDTGFSRDGQRLWLTRDAAYLVSDDLVERWPGVREPIRCA